MKQSFTLLFILFLLFTTYRIDFFNKKSERKGYAIVRENGKIDFYNKKSERKGYAIVRENGKIDYYNKKSERIGHGRVNKWKKVKR